VATSYPDGLDNFTNPTASDTLDSATVPHATQHANTNDAIEAIEAELGTTPKGSKASVKARLDSVDANAITTSLPLTSSGTVGGSNLIVGINSSSADTANFVVRRDANGEFITGAVIIDTTKTPTSAPGKLYWDGGGTVNLGLAGGNVDVALGENLVSYVTNAEATTLAIGEVVYVYSSVGNRISVKRASNLTEGSSSKTLGIVAESIAANNPGFIIVRGIVEKQTLSGYTEGAALYLGATAGTFTATKPSAPNHLVALGWVVRANNGNGQIYVNVQNGFELEELHNVAISSVANGQVLTYDATTELWKNEDAASPTVPATPTAEGVVYGKTELAGSDTESTALGNQALLSNTIGSANVAIGVNALTDNTEGGLNIAIGYDALANNTVGGGNTSIGAYTLSTNTTGENNTAIGLGALLSNTSGSFNFGLGNDSLHNNTSGGNNTAIGTNAAYSNTTGQYNIGIGGSALAANLTGNNNVAIGRGSGAAALGTGNLFIGYNAGSTYTGSNKLYIANNSTTSLIIGDFSAQTLIVDGTLTADSFIVPSGTSTQFLKADGSVSESNATPTTTGVVYGLTENDDTQNGNTALGNYALNDNTTGYNNVAVGNGALLNNTTGGDNVAVGAYTALFNETGDDNVAIGNSALSLNVSGIQNVAIGKSALVSNTANGNTGIGYSTLSANTTGTQNIALGAAALNSNISGSSNTAVGVDAGQASLGSGNVFVGYRAGYSETGSNKLYIANNSTTSLIVGDFSANTLTVNAAVTATSYAVPSGTSSQFLKANGSTDSTTYAPIASPTFTGTVTIPAGSSISGVAYLATANTFTSTLNGFGGAYSSTALAGYNILHVSQRALFINDNVDFNYATGAYYASGWKYAGTAAATNLNNGGGKFDFLTAASGTAGSALTFVSRLQLLNNGQFVLNGFGAGVVGMVIKGAVSQTANLQEWQNSAGTVLSLVDSGGQLRAPNIGIGGTSVGIAYVRLSNAAGDTSATTTVFRGIASQTGDFLRFQNSTPTTLTAITAAGTINFASGNTSATATAGAITAPALVQGYITMQVAGTTVKVPYYAN
jgi:hypothetical protein